MITAQCRISNGPFTHPHTYPAEVKADGSGTEVANIDGRRAKFTQPEFDKYFEVVGRDRTPSGHRSRATATINAAESAEDLVDRLLG